MANGSSRQPRGYLELAGMQCIPISLSVSLSSQRNSDSFSATIALSANPSLDERFFSDTEKIPVVVMMTNDQQVGNWAQMITGFVDLSGINFSNRTCVITGRDKTSLLLEAKTTEKWLNKTSAEIVRDIAARVGLTADVSIPNGDKVGLITKDDYNRISNQDVLWNVLTALADRENCALFVKGDRLVFKPFDQLDGGPVTVNYQRPPIGLTPEQFAQGNFISLSAKRNLAVAKNVRVSIKSWQLKQKKALNSSWQSKGKSSDKLDYTYTVANSTKTQIDKIAKSRLKEITGRERTIDLDMPGDVTITPENTLNLTGTNTRFDQSYIIATTHHEMSQDGFRMQIAGRSPDKDNAITQES